jgi:hypothetical protein
MLLTYLSLPVFIISLLLGLIFIYILGPEIKTIHIYPTPERFNKMMVKDGSSNCFMYNQSEVTCPINPTLIHNIPIQA